MWKIALLAVVLALATERALHFARVLDLTKDSKLLEPTDSFGNCRLISGSTATLKPQQEGSSSKGGEKKFRAAGFEDMVFVNRQTAVSCAGDLHDLWANADFTQPTSSKGSQCVAIEWKDGADSPKVTELKLLGFPFYGDGGKSDDGDNNRVKKVMFHAHGISLKPIQKVPNDPSPRWLLFVLNHAYTFGGERVEIFELFPDMYTLVFLQSLVLNEEDTQKYMGALNDLTVPEISVASDTGAVQGAILVTKWQEFPHPAGGRQAQPLLERLRAKTALYGRGIIERYATDILQCFFEFHPTESRQTTLSCEVLSSNFGMANGIASHLVSMADGSTIVAVVDVVLHELRFFSYRYGTTHYNISREKDMFRIPLTHAADNVEMAPERVICSSRNAPDKERGVVCDATLYLGSIASLAAASKLDRGIDDAKSPGGVTELKVRYDFMFPTGCGDAGRTFLNNVTLVSEKTLVLTDGAFNGVSMGVVLSGGDKAEKPIAVLGSFKSHGLLVCPL